MQDYLGYMWFYTQYGLGKYDGYEMTVYGYNEDSTGISGISGLSLYEDRDNNLWMGTWASGLNRFNRATESFKHYVHNPDDTLSISSNMIYSMYEDSKGRFLVGNDDGLELLDRESSKFNHYYFADKCYSNEIYDYILTRNKNSHNAESILRVGNNAHITKTFTIKKKMQVLIILIGEAGYDNGCSEG